MAEFARDLRDHAPLCASLLVRKDARCHTPRRQASIHYYRSAQSVVTEALGRDLTDLPQAQALAVGLR
ncbi:hypothetical protein ABVV53_08820 [Novosphingobium sp. RD2P27]|uniref:Uncharacterized protein n=1 Tax=Novosphingobium kalidii TaxID=3230299 RepID=A0ABV2D105_9SPHN